MSLPTSQNTFSYSNGHMYKFDRTLSTDRRLKDRTIKASLVDKLRFLAKLGTSCDGSREFRLVKGDILEVPISAGHRLVCIADMFLASNSPLGHVPAAEDSGEGVSLWRVHCLVGTKDALVHEIEGLPDVEHIFHTALPEWVYLRVRAHIMHDLLQDRLACLPTVCTFHNKAIMESIPMDNGRLLEIGEDKLNAYLFDIGDWVTP
ncbi:hypothetical protein IW262DRAFT_1298424 [Armillaria fumosa]|nr:hypothetical protein IW262DRAFT_1298424 [Armillaria fumosa]